MLTSITAAVVAIAMSLTSVIITKEIRAHRQSNSTFKMQRTPIGIMLFLALAMGLISIIVMLMEPQFRLHPSDASAPAFIAILSTLCALVWTRYEVRLDDEFICYGLNAKKRIGFDEISRIVDIRNQGSPRAELVTKSGIRIKIWSNLLGFDSLIAELNKRCNCTYVKLDRRGQTDKV